MNTSMEKSVLGSCLTCELRHNSAFCNMRSEARIALDHISAVSLHPHGTVLFTEGQSPRYFFILCSGKAKLSTTSRDGKKLILRIARAGDLLGLNANLTGSLYEVTAQLITSSQIMSIPRSRFLEFLTTYGEVGLKIALSMSREYEASLRQIRSLAFSKSAAAKLAALLMEFSRIQEPLSSPQKQESIRLKLGFTHSELGEMTGMSRETISRLFARFRASDVISKNGATLTIVKPAVLSKIAA